MQDGIRFTDIREELVSQAVALARTFYKTGDVENFNGRRQNILRIDNFSERRQAVIRNCNHTQIGLNGAKGKVATLSLGIGETIEQGGFPYVGQTNDAAFQSHF